MTTEEKKQISIQDINEMANDLLVLRLSLKNYEDQLEQLMVQNPEIVALRAVIESSKMNRDFAQAELIKAMKDSSLKSWKTEQANFARTVKCFVSVNPAYKSLVEKTIKAGGEVEGWELKESEYLSIKVTK